MEQGDLVINKLSFTQQPIPVPADYRPMYKIGLIVLILRICCRADTSNLLKLHLFSWALSSTNNADKLRKFIMSNFKTDFSVWGIDPSLNRALQFAVAEGICVIINGKNYKLTPKGIKFYQMIRAEDDLFDQETEFLDFVGKSNITDRRIDEISNQWKISYAKN